MREILFRGKRVDNSEWVYGYYVSKMDPLLGIKYHYVVGALRESLVSWYLVNPDTLGQYTGMREFVMTDPSVRGMLFEGDIVEVWTNRRPCTEYGPTSQYDGKRKVRATIVFKNGCWQLDYDNAYNHKLEELQGKEDLVRTVKGASNLFRYGCHASAEREARRREYNKHYVFDDIVCIGNIHDNPELLEAK